MRSAGSGEWTLSGAARLLGEPQHRLIYLCEKGVIHPDLQDAEGRGSSRRFSARNLLEFGVALRLRALGIPVAISGAILHVLRGFEKAIAKEMPGFSLPGSLLKAKAPELKVVFGDDQRLYFSLSKGKSTAKTYGGIRLQNLMESEKDANTDNTDRKRLRGVGREAKEGAMRARVEVSVTGIAQDLRFEA
jgi:DNA-binding transcriptional MerR regulator